MRRPVAKPMRSNQNLIVFWKPENPQDCVWKNLYRITMRTVLQEKGDNSLQHCILVDKFIPMLQAMKIPAATAAVDKEWEKLENILAWDLTKVSERWFWILCSIYRTRVISITNESSTSHGYHIQTARVRRTSSWCSICFYLGKNGRCSKNI